MVLNHQTQKNLLKLIVIYIISLQKTIQWSKKIYLYMKSMFDMTH